MDFRTLALIVVAAVSTFIHVSAVCEVYKWVDADGKVHYSDRKPSDQDNDTYIDVSEDYSSKQDINHAEAEEAIEEKNASWEQKLASAQAQLAEINKRMQALSQERTSLQNQEMQWQQKNCRYEDRWIERPVPGNPGAFRSERAPSERVCTGRPPASIQRRINSIMREQETLKRQHKSVYDKVKFYERSRTNK